MNRLPGLDLLRAIAIVWVMSFHSYIVWDVTEALRPYWQFGWMGVDLFFVLSGYLIGNQVFRPLARGEPLALGAFYLRRAFRIFPAYWTVLALYVLWPGFREAPGMQPLWQFLTYTVNLLIDVRHNIAFSNVWSLCVEEHFYLVFPLLALWLARRPSLRKTLALCALIVIGGMLLRTWLWYTQMLPFKAWDDDRYGTAFLSRIYYPSYSRLDGLVAGVALAAWQTWRPAAWARWQARGDGVAVAGLGLLAVAMAIFTDRTGALATIAGYPLLSLALALLVFAAAGTQSWLGRCRVPGTATLALMSYSLYLVHKPVYHVVQQALATIEPLAPALSVACYALGALLAGALLHYAVERPGLRLRDRWLGATLKEPGPSPCPEGLLSPQEPA